MLVNFGKWIYKTVLTNVQETCKKLTHNEIFFNRYLLDNYTNGIFMVDISIKEGEYIQLTKDGKKQDVFTNRMSCLFLNLTIL